MTIFSGLATTSSALNPVWTIVSSNRHNNDVRIWLLPPMLSVIFTVQFRSRWYLCARKSPYALHPRLSEVSPTLPVCTLTVAGLQPTSQLWPWFSSRWYLCARESPYALHPVSRKFFQKLPVCTLTVAGLQPTSQSWPWTCVEVLGPGQPFSGHILLDLHSASSVDTDI